MKNSESAASNSSTPEKLLKRYDELPGPKGWPIVGNAIELARNANNPVKYYTELAAKYGDMFKTQVLNEKMVVLSDPNLVRILAREEEGRMTFKAGRFYSLEKGYPLMPLFSYTHENWNDIRQVLNVPMKPQYVNEIIIPQLTELNSDFLKELINHFKYDKERQQFYVENPTVEVLSPYAFGSVIKSFLGGRLTEDKLAKFGFTVQGFIEDSNNAADLVVKLNYVPPLYKYFKTKDYKTFEQLSDRSFARANHVISLYQINESDKPRLKELVQERASESVLHPETTVFCLSGFLQGGVDVTAKMLTTLLYRIANESQYTEKMFNELVEVFGEPSLNEITSNNGLLVTADHLKQLRLCKNFIDEVLRVDHVVPIRNSRFLSKDMELGGYLLEKGTLITFIDEFRTQSKYVPRGLEFLPDRHEKGSELSEPKGYLGPFGRGARKCPGERVASTEIILVLINVIRHFKLSHSNGTEFPPLSAEKSIMFVDTSKYRLFFSPREHLIPHIKQLKLFQ